VSGKWVIWRCLDAVWYRYLGIFKGVRDTDFAAFRQDYQGVELFKFSSNSLDITILAETDIFSIYLVFSQ
jgi:hypothetical protein